MDLDFILEDVQRDLSWEQFGTKGKMDVRHITGNGYGCAETRAKTTETCGVPGLPFVFVAKIAGLRGGWALQCARSCCPSYWRYPSIGCQAQILIYISMLFGLGFYDMVTIRSMKSHDISVGWVTSPVGLSGKAAEICGFRWSMRYDALESIFIVIQSYPTEICGSCCKAFHCVART